MVDEHFFFQKSTNTFLAIDEHFSWNLSTDAFFCFISVDEHFFVLHKISTNTFSTTMGLRIFFNISTHIDEHLMYYITLVIFSTFQHKSTNTFFLQKSMNTFWSKCQNFFKCYVVTGRQTLFKVHNTCNFFNYLLKISTNTFWST